MEWTDSAIVLHIGHFRESDIWLRLLFRHRGLCNVFAFGGSRSRRRFCGCLDICNTVTCRVRQSRGYLTLEEGSLQRGPQRLRTDWARLGMAMNCAKFLETLGVAQDSAPATFALYANVLDCLENTSPPLLPLFFRWRMAAEQGFAPALNACAHCGATRNLTHFLMDEGHALCAACASGAMTHRYVTRLALAGFDALRRVQNTPPSQWGEPVLGLPDRRSAAGAIDGFIQYHLGIAWENGRFRRV